MFTHRCNRQARLAQLRLSLVRESQLNKNINIIHYFIMQYLILFTSSHTWCAEINMSLQNFAYHYDTDCL